MQLIGLSYKISLKQSVPTSGLFILGSFWEILSHLDVDVSVFKYVVTDHAMEKSWWGGVGGGMVSVIKRPALTHHWTKQRQAVTEEHLWNAVKLIRSAWHWTSQGSAMVCSIRFRYNHACCHTSDKTALLQIDLMFNKLQESKGGGVERKKQGLEKWLFYQDESGGWSMSQD